MSYKTHNAWLVHVTSSVLLQHTRVHERWRDKKEPTTGGAPILRRSPFINNAAPLSHNSKLEEKKKNPSYICARMYIHTYIHTWDYIVRSRACVLYKKQQRSRGYLCPFYLSKSNYHVWILDRNFAYKDARAMGVHLGLFLLSILNVCMRIDRRIDNRYTVKV